MFLCDLTSRFSGEDYPRFCTNGPSSLSPPSLSLYFSMWWLILVDLQLRISYLMATLSLHWRCVLCPDYFDSQTSIALRLNLYTALEMYFVLWVLPFSNFLCIENNMMMQLCCPELTNRTLDLTNDCIPLYLLVSGAVHLYVITQGEMVRLYISNDNITGQVKEHSSNL